MKLFASLASVILLFTAASAQAEPQMTEKEVEAIVKKVIEQNPELIVKSLEAYQLKQQAASVSKAAQNIIALQGDLKNNPNSPSIGNPNGDVTVIEFFDYHCGYCKHFFPSITRLLDEDKNVRIVFKELPILSEDSVTAARAALAVNSIDNTKYFAYHTALMKSSDRFSMDLLTNIAKDIGIDPDAFKKAMDNPDIKKELDHNKELAQSLNINGTPAIIVGTQLIPGAIEYETLKARIKAAREADKGKK